MNSSGSNLQKISKRLLATYDFARTLDCIHADTIALLQMEKKPRYRIIFVA